jgi:hypothetical protein
MTHARQLGIWIASVVVIALIAGALLLIGWQFRKPVSLHGAVIVKDTDPRKEQPISDVEISAAGDVAPQGAESDSSGFFVLELRKYVRRGHPITLHFRHPQYHPLEIKDYVGDKLYIANMVPLTSDGAPSNKQPQANVGNVKVRYSIKAMSELNVGSVVKSFQIENKGNVPCKGEHPCSPDGKWKAALGSESLDAGPGNEFRDARASCIAGPCPFTRIEADHFSQGGQTIMVSARNWSDTATFLLEAEVFHPMVSQIVHESYPTIFGDGLNFTLPAAAEGLSIEADLDGQTIIFPLGPALFLSWADCNARVNPDQTRVYRCVLKPAYRFQ